MNEEELKKSIEECKGTFFGTEEKFSLLELREERLYGFQEGKAQSKCSKCKDTLENTQLICWTCHCQEKEKVEAQTINDIKELIYNIRMKYGTNYIDSNELLSSIDDSQTESGARISEDKLGLPSKSDSHQNKDGENSENFDDDLTMVAPEGEFKACKTSSSNIRFPKENSKLGGEKE